MLIMLVLTVNYAVKLLSDTNIMGFSGSYSIAFRKHFVLNIENPKLNGIPIANRVHIHLKSFKIKKSLHINNQLYFISPNYNTEETYINAKSIEANLDYELSKQGNHYYVRINSASLTGNKINYKNKKNRKFINKLKIKSLENISWQTKNTNQNVHIKLLSENLDIKSNLEYIEISPINAHLHFVNENIKIYININNIKSESYAIEALDINSSSSSNITDFTIYSLKAKFGSDLSISKISISGSYSPSKIYFNSANFNIFNGEAFIAPFKINLKNNNFLATTYFENIHLEEISKLFAGSSLKLEGKLFGNIKITDSDKMPFMISSGTISNRNHLGTIYYKIQTAPKYAKILGQALEGFHYKSIHGKMRGMGDMLYIELLIRGHNPNFEKGRTIEFNLNVEENLYNLYRSLTYKAEALDMPK